MENIKLQMEVIDMRKKFVEQQKQNTLLELEDGEVLLQHSSERTVLYGNMLSL